MAFTRERTPRGEGDMVACPSCGKNGVVNGLLGGACRACGRTERDRVMEEAGYDRWGNPLPGSNLRSGNNPRHGPLERRNPPGKE